MDLIVKKYSQTHIKIECSDSIAQELFDYFTYRPKGYFFHPRFKAKVWDGKMHLFNKATHRMHYGLWRKVKQFAADFEYTCAIDPEIELPLFDLPQLEEAVKQCIESLNLTINGKPITPHDYQEKVVVDAINDTRALIESPTSSGKTLIAYLITRFLGKKTLIVVPNTQLAYQLYDDWNDYGYDCEKYVHVVTAGEEKTSTKPVVVSTWHSLYKLPPKFFSEYEVFIGDEAHHCVAKSLVKISDSLINCMFRFGMSGSFDDDDTVNKLVLEGLFGRKFISTTVKEMIDKGLATDVTIKGLVLKHSEQDAKFVRSLGSYFEEMNFLISHNKRNEFIIKLASMLPGNVLVLFRKGVHGKILYQLAKNTIKDRPVHYIDGTVKGKKRHDITQNIKTLDSSINICSYGTFSEGVNIPNLHYGVGAAPMKSAIKNRQSLGRGMRLHESKDMFVLYDIGDDLTYGKKQNYALVHFKLRVKLHMKHKLKVTIETIQL